MNLFFLIPGLVILLTVLLDFLYTTLSCNGSGKMTSILNKLLQQIINPRATKKWLGLIYLFLTLTQWIFFLILGGFLVFMSSADMVVDAQSRTPATVIERLYYTGYVFSTLGNGGYSPGNNFSRIFTFLFSIAGFGMLTIGITYLLSVTSAALEKKNLATFISSMGKSPLKLYRFFTSTGDAKQFTERIDDLVKLIDSHTNNHLSFPIVHYFLTSERKRSAAIHLASLYESTRILRIKFDRNAKILAQLERLETSIINFMEIAHHHRAQTYESREVQKFREAWKTAKPEFKSETKLKNDLTPQFGDLLVSQGWEWKHVYLGDEDD